MLKRDDLPWPRQAVISRSNLKRAFISGYEAWFYLTGEDPDYFRPEDYDFFEIYNYSLSLKIDRTKLDKKTRFK